MTTPDATELLLITDYYGIECSLRKASFDSKEFLFVSTGLATDRATHMHLTRENVAALLPTLRSFAETGTLTPGAVVLSAEDRLKLFEDTIDLITGGWAYAEPYFRKKWDYEGQLAAIMPRLAAALGITLPTHTEAKS